MNRGFLALVLVVLGVVMLLVGLFIRPLLLVLLPTLVLGAAVGFVIFGLGAVLLIAGMIVRLKAPKAMPDNEYDHDLPRN